MKDFPLYRSPRAALAGTLILVLPLLLLSSSVLGGMYAVLLIFYLLPLALCLTAAVCGSLPAALGEAAALLAMYRLFGMQGLTLTAVYTLPILAAFFAVVISRTPFKSACFALIGVHIAVMAGCFMLLQSWTAGRLYAAAGETAARALSNWELGDTLIYQMYSMGMLSLPESLRGTALQAVPGGYALSAEARKDLLLSLSSLVSEGLFSLIPSLIAGHGVLSGVLCLLLPLRFGRLAEEKRARRRLAPEGKPEETEAAPEAEVPAPAVDFPDLGMPAFDTWHLPRGTGWKVGLALDAGYMLQSSGAAPLRVAGAILYAAARAVFSIQGAALVHHMQKKRNIRRAWQVIVPVALHLFSLLTFIGIFDQISNLRGVRPPLGPKEGMQ